MNSAATKGEARPKKKRAILYKGICADARALGVTRVHLYRVLIGERKSPRLTRDYRARHATLEGASTTASTPSTTPTQA